MDAFQYVCPMVSFDWITLMSGLWIELKLLDFRGINLELLNGCELEVWKA
jgi:hypothetical protein